MSIVADLPRGKPVCILMKCSLRGFDNPAGKSVICGPPMHGEVFAVLQLLFFLYFRVIMVMSVMVKAFIKKKTSFF